VFRQVRSGPSRPAVDRRHRSVSLSVG
jgi:hypothetical protein